MITLIQGSGLRAVLENAATEPASPRGSPPRRASSVLSSNSLLKDSASPSFPARPQTEPPSP
jgi:hypothetical protein